MRKSILGILLALGCVVFLSGCAESRTAESVDLADASVDSGKGKSVQNGKRIDDFGKRIDDLESRLERLEKLVEKSDYDYPSLRHDVRKDLEERLKKLEKVVALTLLPRKLRKFASPRWIRRSPIFSILQIKKRYDTKTNGNEDGDGVLWRLSRTPETMESMEPKRL